MGFGVELTVVSPFAGEYPSPPWATGTGRGRGQSLEELRGISGTGNSVNLEGVRGIFLNSYWISDWGRGFFSIPRISSQYTKYVFVVKCRRYKILRMLHLYLLHGWYNLIKIGCASLNIQPKTWCAKFEFSLLIAQILGVQMCILAH